MLKYSSHETSLVFGRGPRKVAKMTATIMLALPLAPPPKSPLARYRLLSPSASVRVSPLCLGSMNFGDNW